MQQLEKQYELLDALVSMEDNTNTPHTKSTISFEDGAYLLLDHLSKMKSEIDIIKEKSYMKDKLVSKHLTKIEQEISKMTSHILELNSPQ